MMELERERDALEWQIGVWNRISDVYLREELIPALERSSEGIIGLLEVGLDRGGEIPGFPPDVVHFLAHLVAHEGHHRGQICMVARQLGHPLPDEVLYGLWQWSKRAKEGRAHRTSERHPRR